MDFLFWLQNELKNWNLLESQLVFSTYLGLLLYYIGDIFALEI